MAPESTGGSSMLKSLRGVVQEVSTARDLPETLAIIVRRVREEMETQVCSVYLVDPASGRYVFMRGMKASLATWPAARSR
jgi:signal transduction protein with GAF and PtsI domain